MLSKYEVGPLFEVGKVLLFGELSEAHGKLVDGFGSERRDLEVVGDDECCDGVLLLAQFELVEVEVLEHCVDVFLKELAACQVDDLVLRFLRQQITLSDFVQFLKWLSPSSLP